MTPTWYNYGSGGTALKPTSTGTLRTAFNGRHGAHGVYHRYGTDQYFEPPYTFSFGLRVHARKQPYTFEWGGTAGYEPAIVIHPMHGMSRTAAHANAENIVMAFGKLDKPQVSVSAEIDGRYGFRTGYLNRERGDNFDPVGKGWLNVIVTVESHDHYTLHVDGAKLIDLTETRPTTMFGPIGIGLRLDFFDAEIRNPTVTTKQEAPTMIRREDWADPAYPITGPAYKPAGVRFGMAHFTGANRIGDPKAFLRMTQRDYAVNRGYSVGYNFCVDPSGNVFELRGFDFRPASNNGDKGEYAKYNLNDSTFAVLFLVDGQNRLTGAQAAAGRKMYTEARRQTMAAGGRWTQSSPKPHSETDYTGCPGDGIRADIAAGLLYIDYRGHVVAEPLAPPTNAPAPIPEEEDDMKAFYWKHTAHPELFLIPSGLHINAEIRDVIDWNNGGKLHRIDSTDEVQYRRLMALNGN